MDGDENQMDYVRAISSQPSEIPVHTRTSADGRWTEIQENLKNTLSIYTTAEFESYDLFHTSRNLS